MATTYTLIDSEVLASSAASVTFSSIPADYTDLVILTSARIDVSGVSANFSIDLINGATGFSNRWMLGTGSGVVSYSTLVGSGPYAGEVNGATSTSNTFDNREIYIPSYLASQNKPFSVLSAMETNSTAAYMSATAGLWSNTAAITSITLGVESTYNFVTGSSFYLYGISNA
jgi:hypothetical protein